MPAETREKPEKAMASNVVAAGGADEPRDERPAPQTARDAGKPGFFTIYKKGQGYWTRMGTGVAALLLILLTSFELYRVIPLFLNFQPDPAFATRVTDVETRMKGLPQGSPELAAAAKQLDEARAALGAAAERAESREAMIALSVAGVVSLLGLFLAWRLTNKGDNVDFLIATDSEMKKVNWTSRRELMGSTKVVILFMFMIALILFVIDLVFWVLFWLMGVLEFPPFSTGGTGGG